MVTRLRTAMCTQAEYTPPSCVSVVTWSQEMMGVQRYSTVLDQGYGTRETPPPNFYCLPGA